MPYAERQLLRLHSDQRPAAVGERARRGADLGDERRAHLLRGVLGGAAGARRAERLETQRPHDGLGTISGGGSPPVAAPSAAWSIAPKSCIFAD
jgi:hypothetical protein